MTAAPGRVGEEALTLKERAARLERKSSGTLPSVDANQAGTQCRTTRVVRERRTRLAGRAQHDDVIWAQRRLWWLSYDTSRIDKR